MKQKFIDMYMDWAERTAQLSHARRLQVGAVIVKDDSVISYGYNGMPAGWDNNCEDTIFVLANETTGTNMPSLGYTQTNSGNWVILKTKPEVLHAESNAIAKLAKSQNSGLGSTLFVTHAPCLNCAKLIYQSGISSVLYRNTYRDSSGITFLEKSGVSVVNLE
jgi:dCMP deaminase